MLQHRLGLDSNTTIALNGERNQLMGFHAKQVGLPARIAEYAIAALNFSDALADSIKRLFPSIISNPRLTYFSAFL